MCRQRWFGPHAHQSPGLPLEHCPGRLGRDDPLARIIGKLDMADRFRSARFALDPCLAVCDLTRTDVTAIIDLVPDHDPQETRVIFRPSHRIPMRSGKILDPLHPDRIVDMAQLVNVFG